MVPTILQGLVVILIHQLKGVYSLNSADIPRAQEPSYDASLGLGEFQNEVDKENQRKELSSDGSIGLEHVVFFEIQSEFDKNGKLWCLQEAAQRRKTLLVASICNGSSSQKWSLDAKGSLMNKKLRMCVKRDGRHLKFDECSKTTPQLQWILSSDGTFRYKFLPLFLIAFPEKYASQLLLSKTTVGIQLKKATNREAKEWEKWRIVFEKETLSPTISPTVAPSGMPTAYPSMIPITSTSPLPTANPSYESTSPSYSFPGSSNKPSLQAPNSRFHIALRRMGNVTSYDDFFMNAKKKWESIIVGDLIDFTSQPSPEFDWFGGTWQGHVTNVDVDDVIIGYEVAPFDGPGEILGSAGPTYARQTFNLNDEVEEITTISGIMMFDEEDFAVMNKQDIELVIMHEMGHVLGLGTYWNDMCGDCNTFKYLCPAANEEFAILLNNILEIDGESCSHWAEKSFSDPVQSELMTPYFEANKYQPLTRVTVAALRDLGYEVNMDAADPWTKHNENSRLLSNTGDVLFPISSFSMNKTNMVEPKVVVKFILE